MNKRNFFSSLIVLAFFAAFYSMSLSLSDSASYWPKLICVVGGVLSLLQAALSAVQMKKDGEGIALFPLSMAQLKNGAVLLVVASVWLFCISRVGYLISSILETGILVCVFEPVKDKKHMIRDIIVTLVFSIAIYLLFNLLGVHFPRGLLI